MRDRVRGLRGATMTDGNGVMLMERSSTLCALTYLAWTERGCRELTRPARLQTVLHIRVLVRHAGLSRVTGVRSTVNLV